jgi:hypothetical protein
MPVRTRSARPNAPRGASCSCVYRGGGRSSSSSAVGSDDLVAACRKCSSNKACPEEVRACCQMMIDVLQHSVEPHSCVHACRDPLPFHPFCLPLFLPSHLPLSRIPRAFETKGHSENKSTFCEALPFKTTMLVVFISDRAQGRGRGEKRRRRPLQFATFLSSFFVSFF